MLDRVIIAAGVKVLVSNMSIVVYVLAVYSLLSPGLVVAQSSQGLSGFRTKAGYALGLHVRSTTVPG